MNSSQTWDSPNTSDSVTIALRSWALDNWGEDLLALDVDGGLFLWDTSGGIQTASNVASAVSNAPTKSKFMIVSNSRQIRYLSRDRNYYWQHSHTRPNVYQMVNAR